MDIQTAKQISIEDYLRGLGHQPVKHQGVNLWYKSPLREEKDASFKVNTELNCWYDFGLGKGGNIIALAAELYASSNVSFLLQQIERQTPYVRPVCVLVRQQSESEFPFRLLATLALSSPALLAYLQERGICAEIAQKECREVHYECRGKQYFAIGFPNVAGGFELRNRYFKGCVAPKSISSIQSEKGQRETCCVFEGFMDYLSFLSMQKIHGPIGDGSDFQDYIVLNSVANLSKASDILKDYQHIRCFFDNDTAGIRAVKELLGRYGNRVQDKSSIYGGYKDLNEYWCKYGAKNG